MTKQFPSPVITIISRRVRPGFEKQYEEWLVGINRVSARQPGSHGATVLRPHDGKGDYHVIVQFDTAEHLERWLCSDERAEWLAKLEDVTLESEEIKSLTGMERWFTLPNQAVSQAPPKWKSSLLLLLGLYPLAFLVPPLLQPVTAAWPTPLRVLVVMSLTIVVMVWGVMPLFTRLFFGWLYPRHRPSRLTRDDA